MTVRTVHALCEKFPVAPAPAPTLPASALAPFPTSAPDPALLLPLPCLPLPPTFVPLFRVGLQHERS